MNIVGPVKAGRNQQCPCGSGKKYKRCCLEQSRILRLNSCEITTDPMPELNTDEDLLSKEDNEIFFNLSQRLHDDEVTNFHEAVQILEGFKKKYCPIKRVYNLLGVCYERLGQKKNVEAIINETYSTFPNYLFAKTGNISYWMQKGDYSKFEEVFKNCYDLKSLYPERDKFHISEAFAFFIVCGRYFGNQGRIEVAERYLNMAAELKPDDPQLELIVDEILLGKIQKLKNDKEFREKFFN